MKKFIVKIGLTVILVFGSLDATASWELVGDQSSLHFVSVKNNVAGETHTFQTLAGTLSTEGALVVSIDLASVETGIDIRNERMIEHLFNVKSQPMAVVAANVDPKLIKKLKKASSHSADIPFSLTLNGVTKSLTARVSITKLKGNDIQVSSTSPILVSAADFDLIAGIDKLQQLAGLNSIVHSVPVTVQLMFKDVK